MRSTEYADKMIRIGEKIREARKREGATQADCAKKIGITLSYYSDIENGKRAFSVEILISIIEIFHVSADEILETGYGTDLSELLTGCTPDEKEALVSALKGMKKAMKR